MRLTFTLPESRGAATLNVEIDHLVIAGWTGRDREAILHHIRELAELGVPQPSAIPLFYRVAANQLSQQETIEVIGNATSGEAEPLILPIAASCSCHWRPITPIVNSKRTAWRCRNRFALNRWREQPGRCRRCWNIGTV